MKTHQWTEDNAPPPAQIYADPRPPLPSFTEAPPVPRPPLRRIDRPTEAPPTPPPTGLHEVIPSVIAVDAVTGNVISKRRTNVIPVEGRLLILKTKHYRVGRIVHQWDENQVFVDLVLQGPPDPE